MVDRDDWLIGEDIVRTSWFPSGAMRNIADPHNEGSSPSDHGWQPAHMNEYLALSIEQDNGGVHINSGIPNKAAYLIGTAIGKDKLEHIYYRILDARYLSPLSLFVDMRLAAIQSATDLYGDSSVEVNAVRSAFTSVGILDGPPSEPEEDLPPVIGEEWIVAVNAEPSDNSLYRISPDLVSPVIDQLTTTQVFASTGCPITADREGTYLIFVDSANYLRAISSDGTDEEVISGAGQWWSVALSPDGTKLAATTKYVDTSIYIFDFANPDSSRIIHLYSPTTAEGVTSGVTLYADALDWSSDGEFVLYDAFNSISQQGGGSIDYWDINVVDVQNEMIFQVLPPPPQDIHFGNPSFASTNDLFFAFDVINSEAGLTAIAGVNLFTLQSEVIETNGSSIGFPDYSPDDSKIVFERVESGSRTLRQISLNEDKITPLSESVPWIFEAGVPAWFVVAEQGCCAGLRGDLNGDGNDNTILDLNFLVNDIFRGGPSASCPEEADIDGNGVPSAILDLNYLVNDIFRGGPSPGACI